MINRVLCLTLFNGTEEKKEWKRPHCSKYPFSFPLDLLDTSFWGLLLPGSGAFVHVKKGIHFSWKNQYISKARKNR